jgi:hypothetical protein
MLRRAARTTSTTPRRFYRRPIIVGATSVGMVMAGGLVALAASTSTTQPTGLSTANAEVVTSSLGATLGNRATLAAPGNRASGNDVVRWSETYQNRSPDPAHATVTQTWSSSRQQYVSGSLAVPAGWATQWSVDTGRTWLDTEPLDPTTVNATRTSSVDMVPANGIPGTVKAFAAPTTRSSFSTTGSGEDSFILTFYGDNVYSVGHHTQPEFPCFSKQTGTPCGIPRATGSGLATAWKADSWVDQSNGRAYAPASRSGSAVLVCVDLDDGANCGETVVSSGTDSVGQPWQFGGRVFFFVSSRVTGTYAVACVTVATATPCAGQPFATGVSPAPRPNFEYLAIFASPDQVTPYRADGKVMYTLTQGSAVMLECFDSATAAKCAPFVERSWGSSWVPIVRTTPTGAFEGLCSRPGGTGPTTCYDVTGAPLPVSPALEAWVPKGNTWTARIGRGGLSTTSGAETLLPMITGGKTSFGCFDWSNDAPCTNFPIVLTDSLDTYTLRTDPFIPNCVWEAGHQGIVVSFNTVTGRLGCGSNPSISVTANPVYCASGKATTWRSVDLVGMSSFGGMTITIRDSSGNPISGWSNRSVTPASPTLNISSLPMAGATTTITVDVDLISPDPAGWERAAPSIAVTWNGDPLENCRDSTVITSCTRVGPTVDVGFLVSQTTNVTMNVNGSHSQTLSPVLDAIRDVDCAASAVAIRGQLNGVGASVLPGVVLKAGDQLTWTYEVSNVGGNPLGAITVTDDGGTPGNPADDGPVAYASGDTNGNAVLEADEVWLFRRVGPSALGQHVSTATVTAVPYDATFVPIVGASAVTAQSLLAYDGLASVLRLRVGIYIGHNAGASCSFANSYIAATVSAPLTYCYEVTNLGSAPVTTIRIDDRDLKIKESNMTVVVGSLGLLDSSRRVVAIYETSYTKPLVNVARVTATPVAGPAPTATGQAERADITGEVMPFGTT